MLIYDGGSCDEQRRVCWQPWNPWWKVSRIGSRVFKRYNWCLFLRETYGLCTTKENRIDEQDRSPSAIPILLYILRGWLVYVDSFILDCIAHRETSSTLKYTIPDLHCTLKSLNSHYQLRHTRSAKLWFVGLFLGLLPCSRPLWGRGGILFVLRIRKFLGLSDPNP